MQGASELFDHVLDIGCARLEDRIRRRAEHLGKRRHGGGDGLVGRASLPHQVRRAIDQGRVIEHERLRLEDARLAAETGRLKACGLAGEIRPDLVDGATQLRDAFGAREPTR
jgi:hypothetical protein